MLPKQPVSLSLPPPAAIFSLSVSFLFLVPLSHALGLQVFFYLFIFNFLQRRRSPESASAVSRVPSLWRCPQCFMIKPTPFRKSGIFLHRCRSLKKKKRKESHLFKQWWIIIIFRFYFLFFLISHFNDVKLFYKNQMKCNKDNYYRKDILKVIALQWEDF